MLKTNYQRFDHHLFLHPFTSDTDHLTHTSQIQKLRSTEVLVCEEGQEHCEHNEVVPPEFIL